MKKLAVYDLSFCPITFDFIHFIAAARMYFALKTGDTSFDLLIICDKFRDQSPRDKILSSSAKLWRVHNLLLPILNCCPFVYNISLVRKRPEALPRSDYIYPPDYTLSKKHSPTYYFGIMLNKLYAASNGALHPACLQAPEQALIHAKSLLGGKENIALVSPRFSRFEPSRNTNSLIIENLFYKLKEAKFDICFIHDQEDYGESYQLLSKFPNTICIPEASFNIPLRLALIELARVNLFTPCALQGFAQLSKRLPSIVCFDMYKKANKSFTGDFNDYKYRGGMNPGSMYPYPWSTKNMIFIWDKKVSVDKIVASALDVVRHRRS